MIKNTRILAKYKIVFGLLGLSAIITEITALSSKNIFIPANFFSFFTIESNVFAAIILILSAIFMIQKKSYATFDLLRGAATLYMVTTGIVFSVLLAGIENSVLTAVPWDNTVLHYIMPIILIADWILDPPKKTISFKHGLLWLIFPLVYVTYSLIRGAIVGWYPYPFLNPASSGYLGVLVTSLGITVTVLVLTWVLLRLAKVADK